MARGGERMRVLRIVKGIGVAGMCIPVGAFVYSLRRNFLEEIIYCQFL